MRVSQIVLAVALVATALVLQVSVLPYLPLPGATPDLVLLCVVGLALAGGPLHGAVVGFAAGLAVDLAPPADHAIGRWALVLCVIGYAAGLAEDEADRSAFAPLLVVAAAAASATTLFAGLGALLGDPRVGWGPLLDVLPTAVLYAVALAPFVVSGVIALSRRVAPEPTYF